jgi:16S rRNA (uracil1498-N3)-methyltransferase
LILIGPEGDFTSQELKKALTHGFNGVSLGAKVLRTETAGVMAAVVINLVNNY